MQHFRFLNILSVSMALAFSLPSAGQSIFVKAGGGLSSQWGAAGTVGAGKIALGYEYEFSQSLAVAPSIGYPS